MRLLLTRAEPEAQASAERLRQRGHQVLVAPMLEITFHVPPEGQPDPTAIALTSANAVHAIAGWPQQHAWKDARVFTVGEATADAARAVGFRQIESAKGGTVELAALIARTQSPTAGPILYPAAETPAGDLATALRQSGFAVAQVTAYRASPASELAGDARDAIQERKLDAALFYSERGAAAFVNLMKREKIGAELAGMDLLALSAQVAGPLAALAAARLRVAAEPTEASLFALLDTVD